MVLGLVLFGWVASLLQPGVVGPYLVRGVWFSYPFALKRTGHIQNFVS
jgi:hypothetical protein